MWLEVVGRKTRNLVWEASGERAKSAGTVTKPKETGKRSAASQPPSQAQPPAPSPKKGGSRKKERRVPRTAAVVTCPLSEYKKNLRLTVEKNRSG